MLLSAYNYDSFGGIWGFIANGQRTFEPTSFEILGQTVMPPHFNYFLTPEGEFVDTNIFINPRSNLPIRLGIGFDLDRTQEGANVDTLRLGSEITYKLNDSYSLGGFAHLDIERSSEKTKGHSFGIHGIYNLWKGLHLTGKIIKYDNDIMQNTILGKGRAQGENFTNEYKGTDARLGMILYF